MDINNYFVVCIYVHTVVPNWTAWIKHAFQEGKVNTVGNYHPCIPTLLRPNTPNYITSVSSPSGLKNALLSDMKATMSYS